MQFFPWKLFRKMTFSWFLFSFLGVLVTAALTSHFLEYSVSSEVFFLFLVLCALWLLVSSLLLSCHFLFPLRRIIIRLLRMTQRGGQIRASNANTLFKTEPGEYFDLERILNKLQNKMDRQKTLLHQEEYQIQALISSLGDAVVGITQEGNISYYNAWFSNHFLSPYQVHLLHQGVAVKYNEVFRDPEILRIFSEVLQSGSYRQWSSHLSTNSDFFQEGGEGSPFLIKLVPLKRKEGPPPLFGVLGLFTDLSELQRVEKTRTEFIENASHELRTPLTSIRGYLETLKEDLKTGNLSQANHFLAVALKNVENLEALTSDVLTLASIENRPAINYTLVNPEELTYEVFEKLSPLASQRQITLRFRVQAPPFKADLFRVEQVLINLIKNGIQYIQEGGTVQVLWDHDMVEEKIFLRVRDNGPGIPSPQIAHLFERFYRVDQLPSSSPSSSSGKGGTGLGLAIVKHILLAHRGKVEVTSQEGRGSEFICSFPYSPS